MSKYAKISLIILFLGLIFGISLAFRQFVKPRAIIKIKWSDVVSWERMLSAIESRIYYLISQSDLTIIGLDHSVNQNLINLIKSRFLKSPHDQKVIFTSIEKSPSWNLSFLEEELHKLSSSSHFFHLIIKQIQKEDLVTYDSVDCLKFISNSNFNKIDCEVQKFIGLNLKKIQKTKQIGFALVQISAKDYLWIIFQNK